MENTNKKCDLKQCYVAIATPFYKTSSESRPKINYNSLDSIVFHIINNGIEGIVAAGSTGSGSALSYDQHVVLVKHVNDIFGKKAHVIAADGSNITWEAIELAKRIEGEAGVFTHLSAYGYYTKPSDAGIEKHFETLANNIDGQIILYSIPGRASGLTPEIVKNLAQHPKIIGLKNCPEDLEDTKRKIALTRNTNFKIFAGNDEDAVETIYAGGHGLISTAGNIEPRGIALMVDCALKGEIDGARFFNNKFKELFSALFPKPIIGKYASPNPVMCHYALNKMGFAVGDSAVQLDNGNGLEKEAMDKALEKIGLIKNYKSLADEVCGSSDGPCEGESI